MLYLPVVVEGVEHLINVASGILLSDLGSCQSQELLEVNTTGVVFVELCEDLIYELILTSEAEIYEGLLQLRRVDHTTTIPVKDVKSLLDLDYLILWE
mgnify:FL=1